jgi:methionyl-tRNA formyltransferase
LPEHLIRRVPTHNGPAAVELLQSIAPDIIAVYGTAIIRAPIIRLAGRCILNMHTGISPRYRGADTVFWPLHNAEPEWIGVTIHELTEGVDAGPILQVGRPKITDDDDEDSLFAKCVILGTELYVSAVRAVASGDTASRPQDIGEGREYRFVDRTIWAELRVRRLLARGLLRQHGARRT